MSFCLSIAIVCVPKLAIQSPQNYVLVFAYAICLSYNVSAICGFIAHD